MSKEQEQFNLGIKFKRVSKIQLTVLVTKLISVQLAEISKAYSEIAHEDKANLKSEVDHEKSR
jgi:hypothetical protein